MVFNWFRRQFSEKSDEKEEEQSQPAAPQPETESAESASESASTEQQSPEVAADYLNWAKAAYKNIQKQQQEVEAETATPEAGAAADPAQKVAPTEEINPVAGTQTEEPQPILSPELPAVEEPATLTETAAESAAAGEVAEQVEPAVEPETVPIAEPALATEEPPAAPEIAAEEPTVQEPAVLTETAAESAAAGEVTEQVEPAPSTEEELTTEPAPSTDQELTTEDSTPSTEETPAALPLWARAEADRQARLERLKASAVDSTEPEIVKPAAVQTEEVTDFVFDEGFLWSAEILAAQGRRPEDISIEEITWLKKLRQSLDKTRRSLINQLKAIVGQGPLNQAGVMEIESLLLQADVGVEATDYIINALQKKLREEALKPEEAIAYLKTILRDMLDQPTGKSYNPTFAPEKDQLNIWLITGVNGAGKTTTIGKIAHIGQKSGYKCLIAAADTFRAAAVQQVKIWGQRSEVEVIANPGQNTDPAAVVFDAIAAAQARGTELLLVDTAGRLQNKKNLMEELSKIRRIIDKKAPNANIQSLLVLDATLGQNGLRQAEVFAQAAQLSGVVLTKLDGSAKGGIALAVVKQLGLPIRFIGAGEGIEDLRPFSSYEFVEALLSG
ncbi:signal recognition particle-docking protein FtsY [Microcoleus sp. FACHB-672]|uniref:signal recognition particle-docking protein FtsY n=1 Tax=Microcoleus sp. FACHB-672 TaxID=2692825 RepID=UPI001687B8E1|nr:signal recognition particle-docking protein FtsY [Microcoleus sp. FACHB-672]MBD2041030.1 signal recognition particle-docking protein FtsY [Microcoleus sp. FACHB-672]